MTPQYLDAEQVTDHDPGPDETFDQSLGVVGAGRLPARAVQPERPARFGKLCGLR